MFAKARLPAYLASATATATAIILVLQGSPQAQPRTCDEIQAAIDLMQSEHDQFIANLKKAQVEIACFEAALAALAEAQAALEALDESEDEDGYPTVEYPECSDNYGTLTVEQATALSAAATKAENEAKAGVRKSVLELDREELSYSEGCD